MLPVRVVCSSVEARAAAAEQGAARDLAGFTARDLAGFAGALSSQLCALFQEQEIA